MMAFRLIDESTNSRGGFTVLELLVASMLLGMLMTILTMIFNQSSIAWHTGMAGVADMDDARADISDIRYQADNGYEWNGPHYVQSVFKDDGTLATREEYLSSTLQKSGSIEVPLSDGKGGASTSYKTVDPRSLNNGTRQGSYVVNVMSCGPDRNMETRYDNVYSVSPSDDPKEW